MSEIDYNELARQFDDSYEPEETVTVDEQVEETETETVDEVEETEELDQEETEESEESEQQQQEFTDDKQNKAFAELRRKAQENERYAALVQKMAEQAGATPEEIIQRFEQRSLEQEAEKQNIPVEVLQRLRSLEQENQAVKESSIAERMDKQIQSTIEKYGATDDDIRATFEEMIRSGVDPRTNPNADFEKFYKAANFDKILEAKVNEAKQTSLSQKKKRQEQAAIPNGTSTSQPGTSDIDELARKDAADILANW